MFIAPGLAVVPSKKAEYADLEEKQPLAVHFHLKLSTASVRGTAYTAAHNTMY